MFDSIRGLIKWVIITLLIVLIVFLLIKISGGSSENKKDSLNDDLVIENPMESGVPSDNDFEEPPYEETVEVGDTASSAGVSAIIGAIISGGTLFTSRKIRLYIIN